MMSSIESISLLYFILQFTTVSDCKRDLELRKIWNSSQTSHDYRKIWESTKARISLPKACSAIFQSFRLNGERVTRFTDDNPFIAGLTSEILQYNTDWSWRITDHCVNNWPLIYRICLKWFTRKEIFNCVTIDNWMRKQEKGLILFSRLFHDIQQSNPNPNPNPIKDKQFSEACVNYVCALTKSTWHFAK